MPNHDCTNLGHHFHEPDGAIFNRKRDRAKRDEITVHCCHCATVATKTGYGERNPVAPSMVECGEFVTV